MNKALTISSLALSIIFSSCDRLSNSTEKIGETAGDMVKGIETGVKKARAINLTYTESLSEKGITNGKVTLKNDKVGTDNLLSVYLIFSKRFKGRVSAKAYDNQGLEMGRSSVKIFILIVEPILTVMGRLFWSRFYSPQKAQKITIVVKIKTFVPFVPFVVN
jgi:hypothetical protein